MATLQEILARAQALREETALGSIDPERAGSIMYDTLQVINQMQLNGGALVITKIYASVAAMEADDAPVSDLTGNALKPGQLVVIVTTDTSSTDFGSVYRFDGIEDSASTWSFTGKIGGYPMDETPTEGSTRAVTSGGVYSVVSQLAQEVGDLEDLQTTDKSSIVAAINEAAQTGGGGSNLTGYVSVASVADLPDPGEDTLGYLIGEDLYLYVGTGGDTLDGKYQNCGPFRGPAGRNGTPGAPGQNAIGFADVSSQEDGTVVITLTNGDRIIIDLNHDHPAYYSKVAETNNPSGGFLPDVVYSLGTLTGSVTFALAAAVAGNVNHYFFMFSTGGAAPTITWPTGITWAGGSAPTVAANKKYEISILDGVAYYSEV